VTLGKNVRVTEGTDVYDGLAETADRDGSLSLRLSDHTLYRIIAGDVTLRI